MKEIKKTSAVGPSKFDLSDIVDDGTTYVTIPTPDGWKCPRENCHIDYKHTHAIYESLLTKEEE